jgi:hypothetical protein
MTLVLREVRDLRVLEAVGVEPCWGLLCCPLPDVDCELLLGRGMVVSVDVFDGDVNLCKGFAQE